jgi:hypothetical protein
MELAELGIVGRSLRMKMSVLQLEADAGGHSLAKLAFGPLNLNSPFVDFHRDALGDGDNFLANSRHLFSSQR